MTKYTCVLGDIHLRDDKPYHKQTCEEFLSWFKNWEYNASDNNLILAGDLVESSLLTGTVADYLERLIDYSNFGGIHICCGNHDKKKYHNENQLAYEFYKNKSNVHIYEEATITNIGGLNTLILPYYTGVNKQGKSMSDFYSHLYESKQFNKQYDLVIGHCAGDNLAYFGGSDCIKNLDKLNTKKLILGHIHTRESDKNIYIGSVFAGKKNENDYTRAAMVYDHSKQEWFEDKLPLFNEYLTVTYPESLPKTKALVPIYTILNCASESTATSKYGNIFIRSTTTDSVDMSYSKKEDMERQFSSIKEFSISSMFDAFIKSRDVPYEEELIADCKRRLKIS